MAYVDFIQKVHKSTKRDYVGRVNEADKAECAEVALRWDKDYWDGDRRYVLRELRADIFIIHVAVRNVSHDPFAVKKGLNHLKWFSCKDEGLYSSFRCKLIELLSGLDESGHHRKGDG